MELVILALLGIAGNAFLIDRLFFNDSDDDDDDPPLRNEDQPPAPADDRQIGTQSDDTGLNLVDRDTYGLGGDDRILGGGLIGSMLYGGSGNDAIIGSGNANAVAGSGNDFVIMSGSDGLPGYAKGFGNDGDDTISLNGQSDAYGGDGDDLIVMHQSALDDLDLLGQTATGGEGNDTFAILQPHGVAPHPATIQDFDPAHDRLVIDLSGSGYLANGVTVVPDAAGTYVDLHLDFGDPQNSGALQSTVIRLNGLQDFDPASIDFVRDIAIHTNNGPNGVAAEYGTTLSPVLTDLPGTNGADTLSTATDGWIHTGSGDDSVASAADGSTVIDLGAGNDVVTMTGTAAHDIYGGNGDDSYSYDGATGPGNSNSVWASSVFGGDGNDQLTIAASATAPSQGLWLYGGNGDDVLDADSAGAGGRIGLSGGDGNDTISIHTGQTAVGGSEIGTDADSITISVTGDDPASGLLTVVSGISANSHVLVRIDAALSGPLTFVDRTAENGFDVLYTDVFSNGVPVLRIQESDFVDGIGVRADDPRFEFVTA